MCSIEIMNRDLTMSKSNKAALPSVISVHSGSTYIAGVNAYTQATNCSGIVNLAIDIEVIHTRYNS